MCIPGALSVATLSIPPLPRSARLCARLLIVGCSPPPRSAVSCNVLGPGWGSTSPALNSVSLIIAAATSLFSVIVVSVAQLAAIAMIALHVW